MQILRVCVLCEKNSFTYKQLRVIDGYRFVCLVDDFRTIVVLGGWFLQINQIFDEQTFERNLFWFERRPFKYLLRLLFFSSAAAACWPRWLLDWPVVDEFCEQNGKKFSNSFFLNCKCSYTENGKKALHIGQGQADFAAHEESSCSSSTGSDPMNHRRWWLQSVSRF